MEIKPNVFLDMDSTLIRTYHPVELVRIPNLMSLARPIIDNKVTIPRPGLVDFLEELGEIAHVHLFTAAELSYAFSVVESLEIREHFNGIHSSTVERPNGLSKTYDLDKPWFLVEDTPFDHELTIYKLQCLGLTGGKEMDRKLVSRKVVMTKGYHPRTEPQNDVDLPRVLKDIKRRIAGTVRIFN